MRRYISLLPRRRRLIACLVFASFVTGFMPLSNLPEAMAQSFFETLFGGPKPSYGPPNGYRAPQRLLPPGGINYGQPYMTSPLQPYVRDQDDLTSPQVERGTKFKTVCVRMCDGYYWPVSFSTTRQRFYRDGGVCQSSCGSDAKLFYVPSSSGRIEDAQDLSGLAYSRTPNAFRYRKALVDGCACRPEPWSEAEMNRHRTYAQQEEATQTTKITAAVPAAKSTADATVNAANATPPDKLRNATDDTISDTPKPSKTSVTGEDKPERLLRTQRRTAQIPTLQPRYRESTSHGQRKARPAIASVGSVNAPLFGSGFGGQPKYTWPGDAPARVR